MLELIAASLVALAFTSAQAQQTKTNISPSVLTPDSVDTRLGALKFRDGMPDAATTQKLYDELDYLRAVDAFISGYPGVSQYAIRKGFIDAGINDNDVIVFSGLMNATSLFLTANADTYYLWSYLDLTQGPLVIEVPLACWASSMTCGGNGLEISDFQGPTGSKAESTCCFHPATREIYRKADTLCIRAKRTRQVSWVARFSSTTIQNPSMKA
jgi:hypothetical protein